MTAVRNVERGTVLAERLESADSLWAKFRGLMGRACSVKTLATIACGFGPVNGGSPTSIS